MNKKLISFLCAAAMTFTAAAPTTACAQEVSGSKFTDLTQKFVDSIKDKTNIPNDVVLFPSIDPDEIKTVREDFEAKFISQSELKSFIDKLNTNTITRTDLENSSKEMLAFLKEKDKEYYDKIADSLGIEKEDILFTAPIDWFSNGTAAVMQVKDITEEKLAELRSSDLVKQFFENTQIDPESIFEQYKLPSFDPDQKMSSLLLESIGDYKDRDIDVVLYLNVPDGAEFKCTPSVSFSDYLKQFDKEKNIVDQYINWSFDTSIFGDALSDFCQMEKPLIDKNSKKYELFLSDFVEKHDLAKYAPQFDYVGNSATIYITLPCNELSKLLASSSILGADIWQTQTFDIPQQATIEYRFTSDDALYILRASVGLEKKLWGKRTDIDSNGVIDSSDALSALRASVGLCTIKEKLRNLLSPIYDIEKYGTPDVACPCCDIRSLFR